MSLDKQTIKSYIVKIIHIFIKKTPKNFANTILFRTFATAKTNGAIAQLVEQRTENPCVPGSIPGGTTQETPKYLVIKCFGVFLFTVNREVTYKVTYELCG